MTKITNIWGSVRRISAIGCTAFLLFGATSLVAPPVSARAVTYNLSIPVQPLSEALKALSVAADEQLLFSDDVVAGKQSVGVSGAYTTEQALDVLLAGSGLQVERTPSGVLLIREPSTVRPGKRQQKMLRIAALDASEDQSRRSSDRTERAADQPVIEEVVVTAQKREERLQDVPVPVTALAAAKLVESNQLRLRDYYASVPGLSLVSGGSGDSTLAIRGITTGGGTNSTVAITVDDVPVGTSSALTNNNSFIPDIDPSDLARIEVLRGPQGTLYGASSIGGLIKYVTVDPSTSGLSGRIEANTIDVRNGKTFGYGFRGAVNIPIADTFAARVSGFVRHDPGYIDDPVQGIDGINRGEAEGGHLSMLWKPSESLSLKLGALLQNSDVEGSSVALVQPGLGELEQTFLSNTSGSGAHVSQVRVYTANVMAKVGDIDLTSVSGYSINRAQNRYDLGPYYAFFSDLVFGVDGSSYSPWTETRKFTQEIRAASSIGRIDWLLGGYYTHERSPVHGLQHAVDSLTGDVAGLLIRFDYTIEMEEYAAFADFTVHFTDQFDVQIGGRQSRNHQIFDETDSGPLTALFFGEPSPLVLPPLRSNDDAFTYLVTPRWHVSPDVMVYARLASGYRPGGPNADATLFHYPDHIDPDKTQNYEIGIKGNALDSSLSYDASVYRIDWQDIQIVLIDPVSGFAYFTNAGNAKSQGVEVSAQARPSNSLTIAGWAAWNDAKLTSDFPAGASFGLSGDRLPYSARFSGSLSIQDEITFAGGFGGFLRGSVNYVGERESGFTASPLTPRVLLPSYAQVNLAAGVRIQDWTVSAFMNNVTDRRGVLSSGQFGPLVTYNYIQPRTVGLTVSRDW